MSASSRIVIRLLAVGTRTTAPRRAASLPSPREAAEPEVGDVDERARVREQLRHALACRGRVLEAVAAEADGEVEAVDARRPIENAVLVGGQRPEARPGVVDLGALEGGDALHGLGHGLLEHPPVDARLILGLDSDVARGHEERALLAPAV